MQACHKIVWETHTDYVVFGGLQRTPRIPQFLPNIKSASVQETAKHVCNKQHRDQAPTYNTLPFDARRRQGAQLVDRLQTVKKRKRKDIQIHDPLE